jgi:hypothetical protein
LSFDCEDAEDCEGEEASADELLEEEPETVGEELAVMVRFLRSIPSCWQLDTKAVMPILARKGIGQGFGTNGTFEKKEEEKAKAVQV